VKRRHLFLIRAAMATVESIVLAVVSALFYSYPPSWGKSYPPLQALMFGVLMGAGGLVFLIFGVLLSEIFEAEFTAPVVGLCAITATFLNYKARTFHG
jgi:hypothetical protein